MKDECEPEKRNTNHQSLGAIGDIGCFSFYSNKNMATGEGGMLVTNRDDIAAKLRLLRSHGMTSLTWDRHKGHAATYDVVQHGFNYRIDEIRSAIGREQLKKLDGNNARRRELTGLYWEKLSSLEAAGWILPFKETYAQTLQHSSAATLQAPGIPSCHLMTAVAPSVEKRWECARALDAAGIQTSLHYPFIPEFSAFREISRSGGLPETEKAKDFCRRTLTLPLYPGLTEEQVERVCGTLKHEKVYSE